MTVYKYTNISGSAEIPTVSCFNIVSALARELGRRGHSLDIFNVPSVHGDLPSDSQAFMHNQILNGHLLSNIDEYMYHRSNSFETNVDYLDDENLFITEPQCTGRRWSFDYASTEYSEFWDKEYRLNKNYGATILAVMAYHLADVVVGKNAGVLTIDIPESRVRMGASYMPLVLALDFLPGFKNHIQFNIDIDPGRFEYNKYIQVTRDLGNNKPITSLEKVDVLRREGYRPGGVYVLWYRNMKRSSVGDLSNRPRLVVLDSVNVYGNNAAITVNIIPRPQTREEQLMELRGIDPEYRESFVDIVTADLSSKVRKETLNLYSVAVDTYIYQEENILLKLDSSEVVKKYVSNNPNGGIAEPKLVDMLGVDYVFWVLKQHGIPFDERVFCEDYYPEGTSPLYNELVKAVSGA